MVLNAGDATFHSGMMAHAAAANMTPKPRRAMTCAYMPDGASQLNCLAPLQLKKEQWFACRLRFIRPK